MSLKDKKQSHEIRALSQEDRLLQRRGSLFLMTLKCLEGGKANSSLSGAAPGHQLSLGQIPSGNDRD